MTVSLLILFCAAVCAFVTLQMQDEPDVPWSTPKISLRFLAALGGLVVLAVFIAFPSSPAEWSFGNVVLFLAEHTVNPLRIVGVLLLGGAIFYSAVWALYLQKRR